MNPLENLYETIDALKPDGSVKLVYNRAAQQICVVKARSLQTAPLYRILREINSRYIPSIYRAVEFDGKLFIVEEYVSGRTLAEILNYEKNFGEEFAADIFRQVCECLIELHARRIIHRDLKPANIMLTKDGVIRLIDFGIARLVKDDSDTDTEFLGTRGYAPPEQYGFGQTDARSDIYSLGVTIQRLLGKNYGGWLKKILAKCTKLDPNNRYESAQNLLDDLDRRRWQQNLKQLKKAPAQNHDAPELDTCGKVNELVKNLEDLDAMIDSYLEVEDGNELQKRLLESGAWKVTEEFEKVVYSLTDEDFAEMRAALEEYPIENFDSDTE
ncbi:MAG: serine/threonine protein kinase [Selenomonadaceae bacterium]|nr:serine/threonine protein kinase [Selenomonadaceae bacterium]